jgi:DNA-binding beta-propeller fold protein YncE
MAIRPVRGFPGAAILGDPIDAGFDVALAAISPRQDYALAVSAGDGRVYVLRFPNGQPSVAALDNAMASPTQIVFSPSGTAALLYDQTSGRLQTVVGQVSDLPPIDPGSHTLAISDDGSIVLTADAGLQWNSIPLPVNGPFAAVAFRPGSHDFLAVTRAGDVYLASNEASDFRQIHSGDDQTSDAAAVQFSLDGTYAYIANSHGVLASIELNAGAVSTLSCQCVPTSLARMGAGNIFRLTGISNLPMLLFEPAETAARVWFVPADRRAQ